MSECLEAERVAASHLAVVQYATPATLRATDLSGRHTLVFGGLNKDGSRRTLRAKATEPATVQEATNEQG